MSDFTVRADSVDVEQIMRQIRARIRDKRGVDYTEDQIRELAEAKLEKFLDPSGVRSDLLAHFRTQPPPNLYAFEDTTLFESDKAVVRFFRQLLRPFLKLLVNPNVLSTTLHRQSEINTYLTAMHPLYYELMHNLVIELTRASIELKTLKMRVESLQSRLEFNERRARALEAVVQYKPDALRGAPGRGPDAPPEAERTEPQGGIDPITGGESLRTRRRRRRRGRRVQGPGTQQAMPTSGAGGDALDEGPSDEGIEPDQPGERFAAPHEMAPPAAASQAEPRNHPASATAHTAQVAGQGTVSSDDRGSGDTGPVDPDTSDPQ